MRTLRFSSSAPALLVLLALGLAVTTSGCSLFFNPDNHLPDETTDSGADSAMDSGVDAADSGVTDSAMDSATDSTMDSGLPPQFVCGSDDPMEGLEIRAEGPFEVSVALTNDGNQAHIGYVDFESAMIGEAPFANLERTDSWNLSATVEALTREAPYPLTLAIRRYADDQLAITYAGIAADVGTAPSGIVVGSTPRRETFSGVVLGAGGGDPGQGHPYATLIGGAPAFAADLRAVYVEESTDYGLGQEVLSVPISDPTFANQGILGANGPIGPTFTSSSSGRLSLVTIPGSSPATATLWSGFGDGTGFPGPISSVPYQSHIALISDGTYLVSTYDAAFSSITHEAIDCTFDCTGDNCVLGEVTLGDSVGVPIVVDNLLIATHHVEGLGVAVVTAELIMVDGAPVTEIYLELLGPDLEPIEDSDGEDYEVLLGEFPGADPRALDVDAWVQGSRLQVLVGFQYMPDDDDVSRLLMLGWTGDLCE